MCAREMAAIMTWSRLDPGVKPGRIAEPVTTHRWGRFSGIWVIALGFLVFLLAVNPPVEGCDDAVLMLVTGVRPRDRFSRQLLTMCQGLREMAGDLNALNGQAAKAKLDGVLKTWIQFDSGLLQNPPGAFRDDPGAVERMKQIASLLGEVKALIDRGELLQAHDLLEPAVSLMSGLGSLVLGQTALQEFLAVEYRLLTAKPGYRGLDRAGAVAGLASFVADLGRIEASAATGSSPLFMRVIEAVTDLQTDLGADPPAHKARVAAAYARVTKEFAALKSDLLARNQFGPEDSEDSEDSGDSGDSGAPAGIASVAEEAPGR